MEQEVGVLSMKMSQLTRESHVYLTPEHGTPPGASHGHRVLSRHNDEISAPEMENLS